MSSESESEPPTIRQSDEPPHVLTKRNDENIDWDHPDVVEVFGRFDNGDFPPKHLLQALNKLNCIDGRLNSNLLWKRISYNRSNEADNVNCEENNDQRVQMRRHLLSAFRVGVSAVKAAREVCDAFGEGAMTVSNAQRWYARFRKGNLDLNDGISGRPKQLIHADPLQTAKELLDLAYCEPAVEEVSDVANNNDDNERFEFIASALGHRYLLLWKGNQANVFREVHELRETGQTKAFFRCETCARAFFSKRSYGMVPQLMVIDGEIVKGQNIDHHPKCRPADRERIMELQLGRKAVNAMAKATKFCKIEESIDSPPILTAESPSSSSPTDGGQHSNCCEEPPQEAVLEDQPEESKENVGHAPLSTRPLVGVGVGGIRSSRHLLPPPDLRPIGEFIPKRRRLYDPQAYTFDGSAKPRRLTADQRWTDHPLNVPTTTPLLNRTPGTLTDSRLYGKISELSAKLWLVERRNTELEKENAALRAALRASMQLSTPSNKSVTGSSDEVAMRTIYRKHADKIDGKESVVRVAPLQHPIRVWAGHGHAVTSSAFKQRNQLN